MQRITNLWKSGIGGKLVIIFVPILALCVMCVALSLILPPAKSTVTEAAAPVQQQADQPTSAPAATALPEATSMPEPTAAPTQAPLGKTRDHPLPINSVIDVGGDMLVTIVGKTRPANEIVANGNMFNETPMPSVEYVILRLHVECKKSTNDKCTFSTYEFKTVGVDGTIRDQPFVSGVPESMESFTEFFGGGSIEGNLTFLVPAGDPTAVLIYEPALFGDPIYIALQ